MSNVKLIKTCTSNEYRKLSDLKLTEDNPRLITDNETLDLDTSLEEFGLYKPVVIWEKDDSVLGGNQRIKRLLENVKSGKWKLPKGDKIPVTVQDIPEPLARAMIFRDNKTTGQWDYDALGAYLKSIDPSLYHTTGFTIEEIQDMAAVDLSALDSNKLLNQQTLDGEKKLDEILGGGDGFRTIQFRLPNPVADLFYEQISRFKKAIYPDKEANEISEVSPIECMLAHIAQIPEEEIV
jgi:hypothetical protein